MHTLQEFSALRIHPFFLSFKRPSPHSKFSPSSADRWLMSGCSFSTEFVLSKNIPEEESEYSKGGTLAHSLCEAVFRLVFWGVEIPMDLVMKVQMWDKFQEEQNGKSGAASEMYECAYEYVEIVSYWLNNVDVIGTVIHFGLEMGIPVFPDEGCFGTGDFIIIGTKASVVIDFKYGIGHVVKAESLQLKVYAAGLSRFLENVPAGYNIHTVIYQPRVSKVPKEYNYEIPDLFRFLGVIWESIQISKRKDLSPVEGGHCWWCPAKRTRDPDKKCPSILAKPLALANENFKGFLQDMNAPVPTLSAANPLRDAAILKLHALYPMIKALVEDTTAEIEMRISRGESIPGFFVSDALGNRTFNAESDVDAAALIIGKFPQVQPWKHIPAVNKLKTISEIEKEIGKNKLDPICKKKVTKKLEILNDRMQGILGDLTSFAQMVNNGQGQGD